MLRPVKLVRLCGHLHTVYKVHGQLGVCMVLKIWPFLKVLGTKNFHVGGKIPL